MRVGGAAGAPPMPSCPGPVASRAITLSPLRGPASPQHPCSNTFSAALAQSLAPCACPAPRPGANTTWWGMYTTNANAAAPSLPACTSGAFLNWLGRFSSAALPGASACRCCPAFSCLVFGGSWWHAHLCRPSLSPENLHNRPCSHSSREGERRSMPGAHGAMPTAGMPGALRPPKPPGSLDQRPRAHPSFLRFFLALFQVRAQGPSGRWRTAAPASGCCLETCLRRSVHVAAQRRRKGQRWPQRTTCGPEGCRAPIAPPTRPPPPPPPLSNCRILSSMIPAAVHVSTTFLHVSTTFPTNFTSPTH